MATPFAPSTWSLRSSLGLPVLVGVTGAVAAAGGSSFHAGSKVAQVLSIPAQSFTTFFGAARISFDEGQTWADSYRGDEPNGAVQEVVFGVFSLDTPMGVVHYQARWNLRYSFLVADGSLLPGSVDLYASSELLGPAFSKLQTLYTWPHVIADPVNTGGQAGFNTFPAITPPLLIPGSGPNGEDAFWMIVAYSIHAGGSNNPVTLAENFLWRSVDGLVWERVRDHDGVTTAQPIQLLSLANERTYASAVGGRFFTDDVNLLTATWQMATGSGLDFPGNVESMFGGTLVSVRQGSLISGGFGVVSCDNGADWLFSGTGLIIPTNQGGFVVKLGPSEVLVIVSDAVVNNRAFYSADGGETYVDCGIWNVSSIGDRAIGAFLMPNGSPIVFTRGNCFVSSGKARGVFQTRTQCPLANAGIAAAGALPDCGNPILTIECD